MTKRTKKRYTVAMLTFVVLINVSGCVLTSPILTVGEAKPHITIDSPPNRLSIIGELSSEELQFLHVYLDMMLDEDYRKHHFRTRPGVDIDIDVDTDYQTESQFGLKVKK